jgi:hypothetical protein
MYLVAARFTFADRSTLSGFVTPTHGSPPAKVKDLGAIQPQVFADSGERFGFWFGMFKRPASITQFYATFGKSAAQVFPIKFEALPRLTTELASGLIPGFCTSDGNVVLAP